MAGIDRGYEPHGIVLRLTSPIISRHPVGLLRRPTRRTRSSPFVLCYLRCSVCESVTSVLLRLPSRTVLFFARPEEQHHVDPQESQAHVARARACCAVPERTPIPPRAEWPRRSGDVFRPPLAEHRPVPRGSRERRHRCARPAARVLFRLRPPRCAENNERRPHLS